MITDKTGRKLKEGQEVDILLIGMYRAKIVRVIESPIMLPDGNSLAPQVLVALAPVKAAIRQDGSIDQVYIVAQPEDQEKSTKPSGLVLVQ